jgi:valyl-tRNA synthetase
MEFGTGCLKSNSCSRCNDYELGKKHNLETIDIFNDNGTLNAHGLHYAGKDRFEVRKKLKRIIRQRIFGKNRRSHQ